MDANFVKRQKEHNRKLLLNYLALKEFLPKIISETLFKSYRVTRVYDADKESLRSVVVFFDDKCRLSISEYFICAVKVNPNKKKGEGKSTAFTKSKDLESDVRRALHDLGYLD